jgi:hypothetical protein
MIFSCTKKVQDKLKKYKKIESEKAEVGFYNWYVDLINLQRKNYFIFVNSKTLFCFFIYAGTKKELTNIEQLFENQLKEQIIRNISVSDEILKAAFPEKDEPFRFLKTNSKSVLGSMNEFKYNLKVQVQYRGLSKETFPKINYLLTDIPMGGMKYKMPKNLMREELEEVQKARSIDKDD